MDEQSLLCRDAVQVILWLKILQYTELQSDPLGLAQKSAMRNSFMHLSKLNMSPNRCGKAEVVQLNMSPNRCGKAEVLKSVRGAKEFSRLSSRWSH
ncbi:hypothetical protein Nepgr_017480 [Nepenthes gracilis]|uniref:Uncharacterized protein n=1 Tax=Nepenthes gracilis TaxID=150966 RepID=A0AAD3SRQ1_NEPGR|nr:hypothetical protein Nepgr_017480 [Nepenthes gracilis]